MYDIRELYQQLIIDHSKNPKNFTVLKDANRSAEGDNPLCGDKVTIYLKLENDVIRDISFQGSGCAISKASTSIMTTSLKGKTVEEFQTFFDVFHQMVTTGKTDSIVLGKLAVLSGVHQYPVRVKCATLAWHTVKNALEDGAKKIATTE